MCEKATDAVDDTRLAYADLADGQIHYASCGDVNAPAVLLLHQTPRSWEEYRFVLPLLGTRFRAIAMDTIGFGASARPRWAPRIEGWARVAVELLDALAIERAHVVGHHTGGVIAVEIAATRPERVGRLVLSSTPYTDAGFRRQRAQRPPIDAVTVTPDGSHLTELWQKRQAFYPEGRPDLLHAFVRDALRVDDPEAGHRAVASYRMEDAIHAVRAPTLVLRATADPFASPHAPTLARALGDARVVDIDGGMVPLPDQDPHAFASCIADFLDEI